AAESPQAGGSCAGVLLRAACPRDDQPDGPPRRDSSLPRLRSGLPRCRVTRVPGVPVRQRRVAPERHRRLRVARRLRVQGVRLHAHGVPRPDAGAAAGPSPPPPARSDAAAGSGARGPVGPTACPGTVPAMGNGVLSPQVETLDVFVELFSEIESETAPGEFYNRLCQALCRLTTMQRAVLFLYDESLARVVAVGAHGLPPSLLVDLHGTLEETPVAQRALSLDAVQELAPEQLERELPARYNGVLGVTTLTCTPLSAGS